MRIPGNFCGLLLPLAGLLVVPAALPGEAAAPGAAGDGGYVMVGGAEKMNERLQAHEAELAKKRAEDLEAFKEAKKKEFDAATAPQEKTIDINGKQVKVAAPLRADEIKTLPKEPYKAWSLQAEDLKFDLPVEVNDPQPAGAAGLAGKDRVYVVLPFIITNSLAEKIALAPRFVMVTDKGVSIPETCAYVPHDSVEFSTFRVRKWTPEMLGFVRESKEQNFFEAGQTKAGVAIFPRFDPATTRVQVVIDGLTNQISFKKDLRKVLVLEFVRSGDIFYPGQSKLAFKRTIGGKLMDPKVGYLPNRDDDVHHGFDWVWVWNWESGAKTSEPQLQEMPPPTGDGKQKFWSYKVTLANRTGEVQPLTVERVATTVKVELLGKTVDVPLVDDGRLNVYKAEFLEAQGLGAPPRRFPENLKVESGEDRGASFTVAFRESDYDFDAVCHNLAKAFVLEMVRNRAAGGEKVDPATFVGKIKFGAAEIEKARQELAAKLPVALAEQLKLRVEADLTIRSGLASATRAISYDLYKPAYVPPPAENK